MLAKRELQQVDSIQELLSVALERYKMREEDTHQTQKSKLMERVSFVPLRF
eukprot:m.15850 g.15850  ORF g.15850 m.15850 type:complete len:51 (-) comp10017_c0_seq1:510-662(-)